MKLWRETSGTASVETVLVMPILIAVLICIADQLTAWVPAQDADGELRRAIWVELRGGDEPALGDPAGDRDAETTVVRAAGDDHGTDDAWTVIEVRLDSDWPRYLAAWGRTHAQLHAAIVTDPAPGPTHTPSLGGFGIDLAP